MIEMKLQFFGGNGSRSGVTGGGGASKKSNGGMTQTSFQNANRQLFDTYTKAIQNAKEPYEVNAAARGLAAAQESLRKAYEASRERK